MRLVDQWRRLEAGLPDDWGDASLLLSLADERDAARAAALLAPASSGRRGHEVRFSVARRGGGPAPDLVRRLLARLDAERIRGELDVVETREAQRAPERARASLIDSWDEALAALPDDWTDLLVELELTSTDHLERGALLLSPVNPARHGGPTGLRFRCARLFGYGASAGMVRRCLARLDEASIRGRVRIVRALSDTKPVGTQGPVWYVGGKAV